MSDLTTNGALNTLDPGPLTGSHIVRSRATISEDAQQIVSYLQFDLTSLTPTQVNDISFSATFRIDFVSELNTTSNTLPVKLGRNTQGSWNGSGSNNPFCDNAWIDESSTLVADEIGELTGRSR